MWRQLLESAPTSMLDEDQMYADNADLQKNHEEMFCEKLHASIATIMEHLEKSKRAF
jgi:hypothetical protein